MNKICSLLFSNGTKVLILFIRNDLFVKNGLVRFFQAGNIHFYIACYSIGII